MVNVKYLLSLLPLLFSCQLQYPSAQVATDFEEARREMVEEQLAARDIVDSAVLEAMREVPRHEFVPERMQGYAYQDHPLPIGHDQTISQPYIVALMTQLAEPTSRSKVLEIGTGSGYQAAVISRIVDEVFTIEIVPELAARARQIFEEMDYENIRARAGDGYQGWPEEAPFDIILVTAAAPRLPEPLVEQLGEGGRMVIPVGEPGGVQELVVYEKIGSQLKERSVIPVRFVPMTGEVQKE